MANYIITNNSLVNADTLSHHGVRGMKWGVRRHQNKKKGDRDAAKLAKTFEKHLDAYNDDVRSRTRWYTVDKHGNNRYRSDGKGYFDPSGGGYRVDVRKQQTTKSTNRQYEKLKKTLSKKYDVVSKATYDIETGKAAISVQLAKHGKTYVSTIEKDYGQYKEPVEFITVK